MLMLMQMPGQRRTVFCRGLSLFGALLALALLGMIVLAASTFFETLAAERRARIAVQQLTVLADASASHVHGRFPELLAAARGGPVEITLAQLKGAESLPADFSAVNALGRGYRVLILGAGADAIDVLAAERIEPGDTVPPSAALLEAAGDARLGLVPPDAPSRLAGPTLDHDVSAFQAAFGGAPAVGALAHLFQKQGLYHLFPRRQYQLQIGAGVDVGPCRPDAAFHRVDLGQAHRQGQAVKVDVGDAVARMAVLEDSEHEALPWLGMERAIEEGAALDGLAADGDRQGIMPRGGLEESADRVGRLGRLEGNRGSVGPGGAVVRDDMGRIAAEEVGGLQHQAAAGRTFPKKS